MRRRVLILLVAAVAALSAVGGAGASSSAQLQLRQTKLGKILVNSRGRTIYAFTKDRTNSDRCVRINQCLSLWPAVRHGSGPLAGAGVKRSLIGTITIKGGIKQLTYAGHPLYTYGGDTHAGQTSYVNVLQFGGRWPALNAAGHEVK